MTIPLAREGWPFILAPLGLAAILWVAGWHGGGVAVLVLAVLVALFFRDPPRDVPQGKGLLLAPGDGTVVQVIPYLGHELQEPATQISIFLSVFNVHINRAPFPAVVETVEYKPGTFRPAWESKASTGNEQNLIILKAPEGRLLVKQIAGLIARRVVCRVVAGQKLEAGERFGLIRFGSRVDLIVPARAELSVKRGDRVKGGITVMGMLR
ncbi:phosphatidylserine decarboxylase family protein [Candidatus Methylomirabilis limnetica]|jgi:phosphatidylserine decarboxylase|uniref:Phosphatidylserine decarboxylase proenzyme n=1 Tax=Candidatus Methylomirabilis limnetica TaxID=2033718 RepID=A0A2T4U030_9BACT|nr:phosphatidylserine decarboxylase [Candidatus Methylomirabilis limnetica]PTL36730.1 phosphatidylserine decarboxylase family protein [Candidatus Methylomirabilis limnetica]